ncbi:MAG: cation transporter, partial [Rhodospirillales bacterium]|nr:cation transporter [Rhodospirillales bacterium]
MSRAERLAIGSLALGLAVLALKIAAWALTHSAAFFSDALESVVNVAASAIAFYALRFAARPADANHPYGHAKAEFFAAVLEGVMIVVAALAIFRAALAGFLAPPTLAALPAGIALNALATLGNGGWAWLLLRQGRALHSPALTADGNHLLADVVTSVGIVVGVGLVALTGLRVLDPALAALTGVYVLWSGMKTIGASVGGLMDAAPEESVLRRIREVVAESAAGAIEAHDLRTRHAGRQTFLEFHLVVPGTMTVADSHAIC